MDGMEFFQKSAGKWKSLRTTHHLPFRRAESGDSEIIVESLGPEDERIIKICQEHDRDPNLAVGGAYVTWAGSMAWDKEGENHSGSTVFALIPDQDNPQKGELIRERGYAEIVPVIGQYEVDEENSLLLITEYETMSTIEKFWFPNPNIRVRTSTVKRFGGLNTATFCVETRIEENADTSPEKSDHQFTSVCVSGW
jgi:CpeS-like protein